MGILLADGVFERQLTDGEDVFAGGEAGKVALIKAGEAEVTRRANGGTVRLGRAGPGTYLGEMAALTGEALDLNATAAGPLSVAYLDPDDFLRRISREPDGAYTLLSRLRTRLRAQKTPDAPRADEQEAPKPVRVRLYANDPLLRGIIPEDGLAVRELPFAVGRQTQDGDGPTEGAVDLALPDEAPYRLSRRHFALHAHPDGVMVEDLGSALGTEVNGLGLGDGGPARVLLQRGENTLVAGGEHSPFSFRLVVV